RGGIGGLWWTTPIVARRRLSAATPSCHGSTPPIARPPPLGLSDVARTRTSVVLPAPDGPITATRSPAPSASETARSARWPLGWTRLAETSRTSCAGSLNDRL